MAPWLRSAPPAFLLEAQAQANHPGHRITGWKPVPLSLFWRAGPTLHMRARPTRHGKLAGEHLDKGGRLGLTRAARP